MKNPNNNNVLMVSIKTLKDSQFIAEELEEVLVTPIIHFIQSNRIQGGIGTNLYEVILSAISDSLLEVNPVQIPDRIKNLLDSYIKQSMGYFLQAELVIPMSRKLRNMGVNDAYDTNVVSASIQDLEYQIEYYNNRGEHYLNELVNYIKANSQDYPEFFDNDCYDTIPSKVFKSALFLGKDKVCGGCNNGYGK